VSATHGEPIEPLGGHRPLLMSVQPRFAEAILDGTKTVELRRTRLSAPDGSLLILYATAPTMAVVGLAVLHERDTDLPDTIWQRHLRHMALQRDEFDAYLAGAHHATALTLREPRRLTQTYPLAALRDEAPFTPPQSYRYIGPIRTRSANS
jgi:predicted transcriptional regulator